MPTAARLMAAICLAVVGYILTQEVIALMPDRTNFGYFMQTNVALGLAVGWVVMGRRAGRGTTSAINNGLTGVVVLIFWGLGVQASYEMFRRAMGNRYDGPLEALTAIFQLGAEFGALMLTPTVGITVLVCAVVSGLLTEFAGRRWK